MNILLVLSECDISAGSFNSGCMLAKKMLDKGKKVLVVIPKRGNGEKFLIENNIPYIIVKSFNWCVKNKKDLKQKIKKILKLFQLIYNIIPYYKLKKIIRENNINIVHLNSIYTYIAGVSALHENKKIVWHIREFLEEDQNNKILLKNIGYNLINKSNKIICVSKSIYNKYEKFFDKNKMKVIYNGIDIEKYFVKDHNILKNKEIKLLCVGKINEKKGQLEIVEAIGKLLQKKDYNIKLNLVGKYDKDIKEKIDKLINKYKIFNVINLKGECFNTVDYYSESDIFIMSSKSEAFGRVTIEAMMGGCLIIGKNSAGTTELIQDKKTGILYDNVNDLENKIGKVLKNKEFYKNLAKQGQKFAIEKFTLEKNMKEVIKVYSEI